MAHRARRRGRRRRCRVLLLGPTPPPGGAWACRPVWVPLFEAVPIPGSSEALIRLAPGCEASAFTSPRAPWALRWDAERRGLLDTVERVLSGMDAWAVGPRTAEAVERFLGAPARYPAEYTGQALARELALEGYACVLGLRAPHSLPELGALLEEAGVEYREVHVYRLRPRSGALERARREAARSRVVIVTSPLIARTAHEAGILRGSLVVALGPTTARELERLGVRPACVPERYVLVEALSCAERLAAWGGVLEDEAAHDDVAGEE